MTETSDDIILQAGHLRLSRRQLLGATSALAATALIPALAAPARAGAESFGFAELKRVYAESHAVADGHDAQIVVGWGDALVPGLPAFDPATLTAAEQEKRFGYNNDFIAFMPLPKGSNASDHGLLSVNNEYVSFNVAFPGISEENAAATMSKEQIDIGMAATGHSVVEIKLGANGWEIVTDSAYNRRITMNTEMAITGPLAGHAMMKTKADPTGTRVFGTNYNCGGGVTPWGTVLICEEGLSDLFGGDPKTSPMADVLERYGYDGSDSAGRARFYDRFDMSKEPNEPNRFDWVVEIDPYDPASMPAKRTALGRMGHEAADIVLNKDGRVVVYMGDDDYFEYVYRYVSAKAYDPAKPGIGQGLLDDGVLSVARFDEDGSLVWMPLVHGQGPLTVENGFADQADVILKTRLAADKLGATPMDRPEDIEANPVTGRVYAVMTKNKKRKADQLNAVNRREKNLWGQIVEMIPPGAGADADHAADRFTWAILVQCGDPKDAATQASFHPMTSENGWFTTPDNIAFDPSGRLWVATDGANDFDLPDGIYALETEGEMRGLAKLIFACPAGAEATGPRFTPDGRTLFVSVQHPGEDSESTEKLSTRWPDFKEGGLPRPAIVAIRRKDGGVVGS